MTTNWIHSVNQTVGVEEISDVQGYISSYDSDNLSPIDHFYTSSRQLLAMCKEELLAEHPFLGSLLLVGLISCTENYFREIFAKIIRICPIAKTCAAEQSIQLGSVVWHGGVNFERGAFEHLSFASAETVKSSCKKFLNIEIKKDSSVALILEEYSKVCEMRHGIVHSNSVLAGKNAVKLGLTRTTDSDLKIKLGFREVQECASIMTTLVVSFNLELFRELSKRWAIDWRKGPTVRSDNEMEIFTTIWDIFFSTIDHGEGTTTHQISMDDCIREIKDEFRIV